MGQIAIRPNIIKRLNSALPQSVYTSWRKLIVFIKFLLQSRYVIPTQIFAQSPVMPRVIFSIPHPVQTSIPSLAPILV